jgi:hypothetical protein
MITGGGTYDTVTGAFGRFQPTWIPIAITLAATAAIPLLLMLLFKVVPLVSIDEIEEIEEMEELEKLKWTDSLNADTKELPVVPDSKLVGATRASHRIAGGAGVLLLVALLGVAGVGGASPAQAAETAPAASAGIVLEGIETKGSVQLTATIFGTDGLPLASTPVDFGFATKQFGPKKLYVPLGTVTSDASGVAQLVLGSDASHSYKPTTVGPQEFQASAASKVDGEPVTSSSTVNVTVAESAYEPSEPKPLAAMGHVLVFVLFGIVASIWLTLAIQVVRLRRVCRVKTATGSA